MRRGETVMSQRNNLDKEFESFFVDEQKEVQGYQSPLAKGLSQASTERSSSNAETGSCESFDPFRFEDLFVNLLNNRLKQKAKPRLIA